MNQILKHYSCLLLFAVCSLFNSCSSKKPKPDDESGIRTVIPDKTAEVRAMLLEVKDFNHEMVSNGTVAARNRANLQFKSQGEIAEIFVRNGDRVKKGQPIARLERFELQKALEQAEAALENTRLNYFNELIGMGYALADTANIPQEERRLADVKSGYRQSQSQFDVAKYNFDNATLYAPFDGVVANLFSKAYNKPEDEQFCTVIDNIRLEVDFRILENELGAVRKGDRLQVSPFSLNDYTTTGVISEINPVVDKNGMVRVKAEINGADGKLYEGMNVKLLLRQTLGKQLVIPKSALVLRDNRKVVFKLQNETAVWCYVTVTLENSSEYVVSEGLQAGDSIIYDGNMNLAHETPVKVLQ